MKLRIQGNALRLRLKQAEVATFAAEGAVEDRIQFGDTTLRYRLEKGSGKQLSAHYEQDLIWIEVPGALADEWTETSRVGMERTDCSPTILIEKDFQCLHGPGAHEADSFPNPLETTA